MSTGPYGWRIDDFYELLWTEALGASGKPQEIRLERSAASVSQIVQGYLCYNKVIILRTRV